MVSLIAVRLVYSQPKYFLLALAIAFSVAITMFLLDGFLFLSPVLVFFLPTEKLLDFSLLVLISGLSGLVAPMAIYSYSNLRSRNVGQGTLGAFGSLFGMVTGVCGCSSVGFALITSLGAVGTAGTAFLSNFQLPLRLLSISLLVVSLIYANRSITRECKITPGTLGQPARIEIRHQQPN